MDVGCWEPAPMPDRTGTGAGFGDRPDGAQN